MQRYSDNIYLTCVRYAMRSRQIYDPTTSLLTCSLHSYKFNAVVKVVACSGGAQDEAPKAPITTRRRRGMGGVSNPTTGPRGASWAPPVGSENEFGALLQNPSGGRKI